MGSVCVYALLKQKNSKRQTTNTPMFRLLSFLWLPQQVLWLRSVGVSNYLARLLALIRASRIGQVLGLGFRVCPSSKATGAQPVTSKGLDFCPEPSVRRLDSISQGRLILGIGVL